MASADLCLARPIPLVARRPGVVSRVGKPGLVLPLLAAFWICFFLGQRFEQWLIRPEDIVYFILLLYAPRYVALPKSRLFGLLATYFLMNPVVYLCYYAAGRYELDYYPLILFKELQYFYIAFLMYYHGSARSQLLVKLIDCLAIANVAYGLSAIVSGNASYYGIGVLSSDAPALSGGVYLLGTVWLDIRSSKPHRLAPKWIYCCLVAASSVCTIATISRSSIAALAVYYVARSVLTQQHRVKAAVAAGLGVGLVMALITFGGDRLGLVDRLTTRFDRVSDASDVRVGKWHRLLDSVSSYELVFGRGKGFGNVLTNGWMLSVDSQYLRTIVENGVVGAAILLTILAMMLLRIRRDRTDFSHAVSLCAAMAVLCVPLEALMVSKTGTLFWMILFYLYPGRTAPAPRPTLASPLSSPRVSPVTRHVFQPPAGEVHRPVHELQRF